MLKLSLSTEGGQNRLSKTHPSSVFAMFVWGRVNLSPVFGSFSSVSTHQQPCLKGWHTSLPHRTSCPTCQLPQKHTSTFVHLSIMCTKGRHAHKQTDVHMETSTHKQSQRNTALWFAVTYHAAAPVSLQINIPQLSTNTHMHTQWTAACLLYYSELYVAVLYLLF